jgi:hypothetical protein
MKTYRFLASFRSIVGGIPASITHESTARIQGPFKDFLASQQHNPDARRAFIADLSGHLDADPESLSVELQGYLIPIY